MSGSRKAQFTLCIRYGVCLILHDLYIKFHFFVLKTVFSMCAHTLMISFPIVSNNDDILVFVKFLF